jgi:hypothetical protein
VVAALFGLVTFSTEMEDKAEMGVTDVAAYWTNPRKVSKPIPVVDLDIRADVDRPHAEEANANSNYNPVSTQTITKAVSKQLEKDIVKIMKAQHLNAVALYTLSDSSDSDFEIEPLPPSILDIVKLMRDKSNAADVVGEIKSVVTDDVRQTISDVTIGQRTNEVWHMQRRGRLTASAFHKVCHFTGKCGSSDNYIVKGALGLYGEVSSKAIRHGQDCEDVARDQYVEYQANKHTSLSVEECGLFVDKHHPYLGASPDGLVTCKCCTEGLLEIKCPESLKNLNPIEAAKKSKQFVSGTTGSVSLKKDVNCSYYVQIQGQMAVLGRPWCDFVYYTFEGLYVERIHFNTNFWENEVLPKLQSFYVKYMVPALLHYSAEL